MKQLFLSISAAMIGGVVSLAAYDYIQEDHPRTNLNSVKSVQPDHQAVFTNLETPNTFDAPDMAAAAENSVHAVVHVKSTAPGQKYYQVDPLRYFFYGDKGDLKQGRPQVGFGSGVIISSDGFLVTNNHVIEGAQKIEVTLNDNHVYEAELIGTDPSTDIALLKINAEGLPYIPYGDSDALRLGEWVLAVGNPFNLTSTVTAGIVSAKGRNLGLLQKKSKDQVPLESFIQTDAAVNPGNSGGALVNAHGELVGINTAIKSNTGSYAGYSFAVPVNLVSKVVDDLANYGMVQRAFIGVGIRNVTQELADEEGLESLKGVYVTGLSENGAAADAGIEQGDVIRSVEGVSVSDVPALQEQIGRYRPGDVVALEIERNNKLQTLSLTLRNRFGETSIVESSEASIEEVVGAEFKVPDPELLNKLELKSGVQVKAVYPGRFRNAGVRNGFVITHVDKSAVGEKDELSKLLKAATGGVLVEGVYPDGTKSYYGVGL